MRDVDPASPVTQAARDINLSYISFGHPSMTKSHFLLTNSAVGLWYNIYCTDGEQWKWTVSMRLTFFRQNNAILSPSLEAWRKRRRRRRRRQVPPTSSSTNLLLESVISWTLRKHIAHNCVRQVFSHYKHMSGQEEGTTELGWAFEEDKKNHLRHFNWL